MLFPFDLWKALRWVILAYSLRLYNLFIKTNNTMDFKNIINRNTNHLSINDDFWFPGRWVGGITMILAPLLFLIGMLLRIQYHFFFPQQLQAFQDNPTLMITAYNFFIVGNIFLFPAILTLVRLNGKKKGQISLWGGMFVILGLFARTFQGGINHLAFQLVDLHGLDMATKTIADSYGAFNLIATLNGTIMFGWLILAIGSYLSGTLGLFKSICLGLMAALMSGVLKGTSLFSVVAASGLCIALIPLGFKVLNQGEKPSLSVVGSWAILIVVLTALLYFLGQAG